MNPLEVQIDANRVATFDGHVLELFGGSGRRFHVRLLSVKVSQPNKKGGRQVTFTQTQTETSLLLDDAEFSLLQPLLAALRDAGVTMAGG